MITYGRVLLGFETTRADFVTDQGLPTQAFTMLVRFAELPYQLSNNAEQVLDLLLENHLGGPVFRLPRPETHLVGALLSQVEFAGGHSPAETSYPVDGLALHRIYHDIGVLRTVMGCGSRPLLLHHEVSAF